jgi:hypothetical protein
MRWQGNACKGSLIDVANSQMWRAETPGLTLADTRGRYKTPPERARRTRTRENE